MTRSTASPWQRLRRTPKLGRDPLTLIATALTGLLLTGFLLVHERAHWPWQHKFVFHAQFVSAPAVSPGHGQEVRIAGVPVGEIQKASVSPAGKADLTLRIDAEYPVYKDAHLVLRPKSPLDEMYVELDPGTAAAGALAPSGTVSATQTAAPVQADAVMQNLDGPTRAAITTLMEQSDAALASMPTALAPGLDSTNATLTDLKKVADALNTRRAALATLVSDLGVVSQAVGHADARIASLVTAAQATLNALDAKNFQLNASLAQLPGFVDTLHITTQKVSTLAAQLTPTLGDIDAATSTLPRSLTDLRSTLDQLADLSKTAGPLVVEARPVVSNLRPLLTDSNASLVSLRPFTRQLDSVTNQIVTRLDNQHDGTLGYLKDFLYQTTSVGSLSDGNGAIFRAEIVESAGSLIPTSPNGSQASGSGR